ncbi:MAG: sigma-54 dependent transcriptional regulator [Candidatus Tectomicrobia bacterium]|nr:sigma-54 dependent transcriptional regulator [Candidatus Tectomicrobia bacterium]
MTEPAMETAPARDTPMWPAPVAPGLLVSVRPGKEPMVEDVTPQLAALLGRTEASFDGCTVAEAFDSAIPALSAVVDQVADSGLPVRDYRVMLTDRDGADHTVLIRASRDPELFPDGRARIVIRLEAARGRTDPSGREGVSGFSGLMGRSRVLRDVWRKIEIYGPTDAPVVITGETGTGKELTARALHDHSKRRGRDFIAVNCAALSEELLESELFGHERGAFTSAVRAHRGRFERAHEGTLFLDEIGEIPLRLQAKLLRVLEEGVMERVGGERQVKVDVRMLAATNVSLEQAVLARSFRSDLYYRLEVLRVHMPALRERSDDVPLLVEHFLRQLNGKYARQVRRLTPEALALLEAYAWPGNVRELRNVLERVYVETTSEIIGRRAFDEWVRERSNFAPGSWDIEARDAAQAARPPLITPMSGDPFGPRRLLPPGPPSDDGLPLLDLPGSQQALTLENMTRAYRQAGGNITQAAKLLGVHKVTLYRHMKALGVTRSDLAGQAAKDAGIVAVAGKGSTHE